VTRINSHISALTVLFAGSLAVTAFAPYGWYPVAVVSLAVLFNQWLSDSPGQALLHGSIFGLGYFGAGVSWIFVSIYVYGQVHMSAAILVTVVFVAVLSLYLHGLDRFMAVTDVCGRLDYCRVAAWLGIARFSLAQYRQQPD